MASLTETAPFYKPVYTSERNIWKQRSGDEFEEFFQLEVSKLPSKIGFIGEGSR